MKKNFKKLFAILMTVAVVLSMAMPAMAAKNNNLEAPAKVTTAPVVEGKTGSLTINGTGDRSYSIYPVFTAIVEDHNDTYTWKAVDGWSVSIPTIDELMEKDAAGMRDLAQELADSDKKPNKLDKEVNGNSIVTDIPLGYYLVVDNADSVSLEKSQPILVAFPQAFDNAWEYEIAITPKSSSTSFTKKIKEGETLVDYNTKNVGEYVEYRLWANVPTYDETVYTDETKGLKFNVTDQMSSQLTWDAGNEFAVYVIDAPASEEQVAAASTAIEETGNYKLTKPEDNTPGGKFIVEFTRKFMQDNRGKVVVISFKALLNNTAVIGDRESLKDNVIDDYNNPKDEDYNGHGNPNVAKLEYSNSFYGSDEVEEIEDNVTTFTFDIDVHKVDSVDKGINLKDAEFTVYKTYDGAKNEDEDQMYTNLIFNGVLKTGENGLASAQGLNDDITYYLKETKAPEGYKVYPGVIAVTINKQIEDDGICSYTYTVKMDEDKTGTSGQTEVEVVDDKGTTLPGTGGIGTTIFTFGGLALIVLAGILLVVYTRKQKKA